MRSRRSGIKIYRAEPERRKRSRGSLSFFILQSAAVCIVAALWWNALLSVFRLPVDMVRLYIGTASVVFLSGAANRRFGAGAVLIGIAAAAALLWYSRDTAVRLYEWIFQNYETIFTVQPEGEWAFSYVAVLLSVPVLEVLLYVQRTGKGRVFAGLILCEPFIAAACAGWFQTKLPSWLLILGTVLYFSTTAPGGERSGKGIFMWRNAVLTVAGCSVLALLSFQAGKLLDTGRETDNSFYFRMRGTITTKVVGGIEDLVTAVTGEERPEELNENTEEQTRTEDAAQDDTVPEDDLQEGEAQNDMADQETVLPDSPLSGENSGNGIFESPHSYADSGIVDLGSIAYFEPSTGELPVVGVYEKPGSTVYIPESWGTTYSDNSWIMTDEAPTGDVCTAYPQEIRDTLSALCSDWAGGSIEEVSLGISRELAERAVYDTSPGATPAGEDFVEYFLLENRKGFCVHFATAATLMYRYCGYTARYTEGYAIPPSAFYETSPGQYQAQLTGEMGHAWCQVYDEQTGEWQDMEHTPPAPADVSGAPPAASSDYEETIRERMVYDILPVLLPVCLAAGICILMFFGQAALRTARREQRFRKKKGGKGIREMYASVIKTAEFQGIEVKEPMAEDMAEQLYTEYPTLEEEEWKWMYSCVMESMFYHSVNEKNDWKRMRILYTRFRKAALDRMSRGQRWRFRYVHCL